MIFYSGTKDIKLNHTAVALGKFDGLHRGHQILIDQLADLKTHGYQTVMFTFDFHPMNLLSGRIQPLLYTREERKKIVESMPVDVLIEYPFTQDTAHMLPETFIKEVLVEKIGASVIVVGNDFHFGYQRKGDIALLGACQDKYGYQLIGCEKLCMHEHEVSATLIRDCIREGKIELANELLNRPYEVNGIVVHGKALGRTVDMPTANIIPDSGKLLPPDGVYATKTVIAGSQKIYYSLTNIGTNPTVEDTEIKRVETYIYNYSGDLYDKTLSVEFYRFIRSERKFAGLSELRTQMTADREQVRKYFEGEADVQ